MTHAQATSEREILKTRERILELEDEFGKAMLDNDANRISQLLSDDWIIIDPDGQLIDKSRFLAVIQSGDLSHQGMDSDDIRISIHGDTATVTALTTTRTTYKGQAFTTKERATDVFSKTNGEWKCVLTHLTTIAKT
jgi:ketosteroid isomerase-like protein